VGWKWNGKRSLPPCHASAAFSPSLHGSLPYTVVRLYGRAVVYHFGPCVLPAGTDGFVDRHSELKLNTRRRTQTPSNVAQLLVNSIIALPVSLSSAPPENDVAPITSGRELTLALRRRYQPAFGV
jgi:hypothetical protein